MHRIMSENPFHISIPKTGVFVANGHHQLRISGLLFFARGVPTNQ